MCGDRWVLNDVRSRELEPHTMILVFGVMLVGTIPMGLALGFAVEHGWNAPTLSAVCGLGAVVAAGLGFVVRHHRQAKRAIGRLTQPSPEGG